MSTILAPSRLLRASSFFLFTIAERSLIASIFLCASLGCGTDVKVLSANESPLISAISIEPQSPSISTHQTAQLRAIATYTNGTTSDITSTADWTSSTPTIVALNAQGVLSCSVPGNARVSASAQTVSVTATVTCSAPQIATIRLVATPPVIRSNSPFQYQMLADYVDGSTADVTTSATWATDPSIASVSTSGLVYCNNPGTASLSGSISGLTVEAPYTCVLHSITPTPGFVESAKTFDGPFASWVNVKTVFGAKGDGTTDDTAAFQAALNSLAQSPAVLWIPSGTYVLTQGLLVKGLQNITILAEDPLTTTILWKGPYGGTMLTLSGCMGFNIGRLTWDGQNATSVAIEVTWDGVSNFYPTRNLIHDSRIINTAAGIHSGYAGETTVERVHFDHNTQAGVSLGDYDALNWNVVDCLFTDDAIGVTNWYGAGGAFDVTNSVFVRSTTADIQFGSTGPYSFRSNLSVDSKTFLTTAMTGASANVIIQGNTIYHPGSTPIQTGTPGTLMILDNRFLNLDPSFNIMFSFCNSPIYFISVGNTYAVPQPYSGNIGTYTSVDQAIDPDDSAFTPTVPTEVYIPPFSHRPVFEVASGSSDAAIQSAVNAAVAVNGIVHLPAGTYNVGNTLEIPLNANVGILGDGALSNLRAQPTLQGPLLKSHGKTVQLEDLGFCSYSGTEALIELRMPDTPSTRVFCDECSFQIGRAHV